MPPPAPALVSLPATAGEVKPGLGNCHFHASFTQGLRRSGCCVHSNDRQVPVRCVRVLEGFLKLHSDAHLNQKKKMLFIKTDLL